MSKFIYFWFRRDLRIEDNHGLFEALNSGFKVVPVFVFDKTILEKLDNPNDSRVTFIHQTISNLKKKLQNKANSDVLVEYGYTDEVWKKLLNDKECIGIYTNEDYEPQAIKRDNQIEEIANYLNKVFKTFKDQVIFAKDEVVKDDGKPYTVYTPFMKKWKTKLFSCPIIQYPSEQILTNLKELEPKDIIYLKDMGFSEANIDFPPLEIEKGRIKNYSKKRDIPSILGTSRLSLHFRFGTLSIREKYLKGSKLSEKWINELIWREFYMQILYHFPNVVNQSFKPQYDLIQWRNNEEEFEAWKNGKTGYPIVDAGMRELNNTGFMHNRVRMIVASFLTKHLLIDWRWGEAYFAEKLLDFELASNNGGWQWAAGSGVDAAPYFRVFNPTTQLEKFDPDLIYVKKWVPEFGTQAYSKSIVDHKFARERCLDTYKAALKPE